MFKIESNINEYLIEVKLNLKQLIDADKVLRQAALDTVALISDRVQQKGLNTAGEPIKERHNTVAAHKNNKTGKIFTKRKRTTNRILIRTPYSEEYAKKRMRENLQIDHVDLTFSGDMMGDFLPVPYDKTTYIVGFRGQSSSDKADWNEAKFGTIFELSESEKKIVGDNVIKNINAIISNRHK